MIAYIAILLLAAVLIAFWIWMRTLERDYLGELAKWSRYHGAATDPWEEPTVLTLGGIHDVEEDQWT